MLTIDIIVQTTFVFRRQNVALVGVSCGLVSSGRIVVINEAINFNYKSRDHHF